MAPNSATLSRWQVISCLMCIATVAHGAGWPCHTIDQTSRGADGVRLGDVNHDGFMDLVTGWEEGGVTRLSLNPGPDHVKDAWPSVTVGPASNVEDAVLADLDGDGALDVISCCEGTTATMYVHWGPKETANLLDAAAWKTQAIPATAGKQMWMYCSPLQIDGAGGIDLLVGSKGPKAAVGWLASSGDPRDLTTWRYHKIHDAGWIMSLERDQPVGQKPQILVTDRKGPTRSVYLLSLPRWKEWNRFNLESGKSEYMFGCITQPAHTWAVATRNGELKQFARAILPTGSVAPAITVKHIPNPFSIQHGKAVAYGRIDDDSTADFVVSFNTTKHRGKPGVCWIKVDRTRTPENWTTHDISGLAGKKFDRIELLDIDSDGDLDVLTCEEVDNLGVIWYENPSG